MEKRVFYSSVCKGDEILIQRKEGYIVTFQDGQGEIEVCFEPINGCEEKWRIIERSTGMLVSECRIGTLDSVKELVREQFLWNLRIMLNAFDIQPRLREYKKAFADKVEQASAEDPPPA